jgi:hypothetical protein
VVAGRCGDQRLAERGSARQAAIVTESWPEVAASEHDLIMMARALVAPADHDPWNLRGRAKEMPKLISPACAALVADALRQIWPALWRGHGSRPETMVRGGATVTGRPWQRDAPIGLPHSAATLEILRWLVATRLGTVEAGTVLHAHPLAMGDQVVLYFALELVRDQAFVLARQPLASRSSLVWLGYAHLLENEPPPFDDLVDGAGSVIVEAIAPELAKRWLAIECTKREFTDPTRLATLGRVQDAVLARFMAACDRRRRRDLAAWILDAAAPSLARGVAPYPANLDPKTPLSVRAAGRLGAGALLRAVVRWCDWDQQHRMVRFIDDDYQLAQHLLARFERLGHASAERAAAWLADLAALTPAPPSATIERP